MRSFHYIPEMSDRDTILRSISSSFLRTKASETSHSVTVKKRGRTLRFNEWSQ